jgi:hypothetical protein
MAIQSGAATDRIESSLSFSTQALSWMAWFYLESIAQYMAMWQYPWDGADRFKCFFESSNEMVWGDYADGDQFDVTSSASSIATGKWICAAGVADLTDTSGTAHIYLGDLSTVLVEDSASQSDVTASRTLDPSGTFYVMNESASSSNYLDGHLAVFILWTEILTLNELKSYQFQPRADRASVEFFWMPGLHGATTVVDLSGQGNSGTGTGLLVSEHVPLGPPFGFDLREIFTVSVPVSVTVNDSTHAHTAESTIVDTIVSLLVAGGLHAHDAESVALTIVAQLAAAGSLHAHTAEVIPLTFTGQLVADDGSHTHLGASTSLIAKRLLSVGGSLHAHSGAGIVLEKIIGLLIAGGLHAHTAESIAATIVAQLTAAGSLHAHAAEEVALAIIVAIVVVDSLHSHAAESVIVDTVINLLIAGGLHAHDAESVALTIVAQLAAAGGLHAHAADDISIVRVTTLVIDDVLHDLSSDQVTLAIAGGETYLLVVEGGLHAHMAASVILSDAWKRIIIEGRDARTGRAVKIIGSYREI